MLLSVLIIKLCGLFFLMASLALILSLHLIFYTEKLGGVALQSC